MYWCRDGELLRGVMVLQYVLLRKREVSVWTALNLLPDGRGWKRELAGKKKKKKLFLIFIY